MVGRIISQRLKFLWQVDTTTIITAKAGRTQDEKPES
jgi:hypothetical protein